MRFAVPRTTETYFAVLLLMAATLAGCSGGIKAENEFDVTADFSTYKTFNWMTGGQATAGQVPEQMAAPIDGLVKSAVEEKLGEKGFRLETERKPHLLVIYQALAVDKQYTAPEYESGSFEQDASRHQFATGALIIDFVDADTNRLVWRGWATATVPKGREEPDPNRIRDAVRKILAEFPPK